MKTLLVREPSQEKLQVITVGPGGGYFDQSRVLHDLTANPALPQELQDELDAQTAAEEATRQATQYQRDRKAEYPSIEDQLDLLFHQGIDGWRAAIQAIKDKYPKPGGQS